MSNNEGFIFYPINRISQSINIISLHIEKYIWHNINGNKNDKLCLSFDLQLH